MAIGDFGIGSGELRVPKALALECADHVLKNEIDIAISYSMEVDHGLVQTLTHVAGSVDRYAVIPIFINAAASPLPSCKRARLLGEAVGSFIKGLDKRVLIVGSEGLSHDPPIPQMAEESPEIARFLVSGRRPSVAARAAREARTIDAGRRFAQGDTNLRALNPEWDLEFITLMASQELERADSLTSEQILACAGKGGARGQMLDSRLFSPAINGRLPHAGQVLQPHSRVDCRNGSHDQLACLAGSSLIACETSIAPARSLNKDGPPKWPIFIRRLGLNALAAYDAAHS